VSTCRVRVLPSDDAEYAEFVRIAWPRLYRTAYLLLGDHALAEDLVQTTPANSCES
jgi:DNA-directed RNA polymerase specialized sigma24 family protein